MWDDDRIGYTRPWPRLHEAGLAAASVFYDALNYWEEDKASSASSKNSLTTRTQHMGMDDLQVKPLMIHPTRNSSPHAERLLADYHKHLEHDSDCYIQEDDRAKTLRGQSEEIDHEQDKEDDRPPRDDQDTTLELS